MQEATRVFRQPVGMMRLSIKKGDPGRPVMPISIRSVNFNEAICDFGASVNIMPKVIYERIFDYLCASWQLICSFRFYGDRHVVMRSHPSSWGSYF
jgi:hypothetical protein